MQLLKSYTTPTEHLAEIQDALNELRKPISCVNVTDFGDLDLLYKNENELGSRIKAFKFSSVFGHIESFLDDMDQCISNVRKETIFNEKCGYQFPGSSTVDAYHNIYDLGAEDHFVNETRATVNSAIDRISNRLYTRAQSFDNVCITGKVGSGKSTFISYLLEAISRRFEKEGKLVAYTLISYEEVKANFRSAQEIQNWRTCFEQRILDQAIYYGIKRLESNNAGYLADTLKSWFDTRNSIAMVSDIAREQIIQLSSAIAANRIKEQWDAEFVEDYLNKDTKKLLLDYLIKKCKIKLIVVYDGFDAFSLDKIINKNYEQIVQYFSESIFMGEKVLNLPKESCCSIISLRDCTYARLLKILNPEDKITIDRWRICPPGVLKALYRGIHEYFERLNLRETKSISENDQEIIKNKNSQIESNFIDVFNNIHNEIKKEFKSQDDDIIKIFNQNYRRMKTFYILILRQLVSDAIKESGQINKEEFFEKLTQAPIGAILKKHDILELLIITDRKIFFNFFSDIDYDNKGVHGEANASRGLVDNAFGYSFQQFTDMADIPISLVKIRILQFLIRVDHHVKAKDVADELQKLGYFIEEERMHHILYFMGEVGFIKNRFSDEHKLIVYIYTTLGRYVVEELLCNNRYLEHVVQKSLLPKKLIKHMHSMCKYCDPTDARQRWVFYSSLNICALYNYTLLLESKELEWYAEYGEAEFISNYSLKGHFVRAIDSLEYVFHARVGGGFIDVGNLKTATLSLKSRIQNEFCYDQHD